MRRSSLLALLPACALFLASSNGEWLRRVSPRDHARVNPLAATPESRTRAARGGAQLFYNECAKCHGSDGGGLHGRPPVISDRINNTSDGDLFWLMTNGNPWHGMPAWIELPAGERWQLVTYLRELNTAEAGPAPQAKPVKGRPAPTPEGEPQPAPGTTSPAPQPQSQAPSQPIGVPQ